MSAYSLRGIANGGEPSNHGSMRMLVLGAVLGVAAAGCIGSSADWRPARGSADLPAKKVAYRVKQEGPMCQHIGFVTHARSIESLADAVAEHGGTHFVVLDDYATQTVETDSYGSATRVGNVAFGSAHASSEVVEHHVFTGEAFLCQ